MKLRFDVQYGMQAHSQSRMKVTCINTQHQRGGMVDSRRFGRASKVPNLIDYD